MGSKTCSACAGTGHPVTTIGSGGFTRDYSTNCTSCWGTGSVNVPDSPPPRAEGNGKKSGCFVATAAYGDFDAPEVLFLRNFRDESLNRVVLGRAFVWAYYSVSPPLAAIIAKSKSLRKIVRRFLLQPIIFALRTFDKFKK